MVEAHSIMEKKVSKGSLDEQKNKRAMYAYVWQSHGIM